MKKIIVAGLILIPGLIGNLKAESFEEWSRARREQWAEQQAAWQDYWDRQDIENRMEALEAEAGE